MGGQKVNDHSFWAGKASEGSVFPMGAKVKKLQDAKGAGELERYEDNEQEVLRAQEMGRNKIKSHPMKSGYRN